MQPRLLTTNVHQRGVQALLWVIFVVQLGLPWGILQSVIRELFSGVVPGRVPVEAWGAFFELWCVILRHFGVHFESILGLCWDVLYTWFLREL